METVVTWFRERAHRLQQEVLEARGEQFAEDRESCVPAEWGREQSRPCPPR